MSLKGHSANDIAIAIQNIKDGTGMTQIKFTEKFPLRMNSLHKSFITKLSSLSGGSKSQNDVILDALDAYSVLLEIKELTSIYRAMFSDLGLTTVVESNELSAKLGEVVMSADFDDALFGIDVVQKSVVWSLYTELNLFSEILAKFQAMQALRADQLDMITSKAILILQYLRETDPNFGAVE